MKTKRNLMKKLTLFAAAFAFCAVLTAKPMNVNAAVPAPTDLYQSGASTTAVEVSWTDSLYVDYYEVQISETGAENTYVSETIYATGSKTIYGLTAGRTYFVRVRACDPEYSSWVTIKVDTAPNNITTLTQTNATNTSVTVAWNAVSGANGYYIYKALPSDTSWTPVGPVAGTSYTLSGIAKNSLYDIAVVPYRNTANAKVLVPSNSSSTYWKDIRCVTVPTTPSSLKIDYRNKSSNRTDFVWTPTSTYNNTDGYQLQVYYIKKTGKAKKLTTKTTTSYYTDGVTVNASKLFSYACKYRVRSYVTINNKKYYSAWSSYKTYIPGAVPKKITRSSYRATGGTLKWSKVNGAKSYTVYWKAAADDKWKAVAKNVKGTSAYVKYSPSATYNYYYVRANKVKVTTKSRKNSSSASKNLDAYRTY